MEHAPSEKLETRILQMEIAVSGAQAELNEAETLLREAHEVKDQLEVEIRRGTINPEFMRNYQVVLTKINLLQGEREKFVNDLKDLQTELQALLSFRDEVGNIGGPTGLA